LRPSSLYRTDVREAVRLFRPVLQGLKIRSNTERPIVFLAQFDQLAHLNIDMCTVQVVLAEMNTQGMLLIKFTKQGSLRVFIVMNKMLYNNPKKQMREIRKMAGVHEFVHFLAMVYVVTATDTKDLRERLMVKLRGVVDKLPGADLLTFYSGLINGVSPDKIPVFPDGHFRLGYEGQTPDYDILFLHFMFSRELFETYFGKTEQDQFRDFMMNRENEQAIQIVIHSLNKAANDKDVPVTIAMSQLMEWAHVYLRPTA
jgi:hypothetical protein